MDWKGFVILFFIDIKFLVPLHLIKIGVSVYFIHGVFFHHYEGIWSHKLYTFLRHGFDRWPLNYSFRLVSKGVQYISCSVFINTKNICKNVLQYTKWHTVYKTKKVGIYHMIDHTLLAPPKFDLRWTLDGSTQFMVCWINEKSFVGLNLT